MIAEQSPAHHQVNGPAAPTPNSPPNRPESRMFCNFCSGNPSLLRSCRASGPGPPGSPCSTLRTLLPAVKTVKTSQWIGCRPGAVHTTDTCGTRNAARAKATLRTCRPTRSATPGREAGGERTAPGHRARAHRRERGIRRDYGVNANNGGQHEHHRRGDGLGPLHRCR